MPTRKMKDAFDALEKMYVSWKKNVGRDAEMERTIGELRRLLAKSDFKKDYELQNLLKNVEITELRESVSGKWHEIARADWERVLSLAFGKEYKGNYHPDYDFIWVFPDIPEINQRKQWIVIKGRWKG
jgi:hypothetical protein